jgi:hypothetical protein
MLDFTPEQLEGILVFAPVFLLLVIIAAGFAAVHSQDARL